MSCRTSRRRPIFSHSLQTSQPDNCAPERACQRHSGRRRNAGWRNRQRRLCFWLKSGIFCALCQPGYFAASSKTDVKPTTCTPTAGASFISPYTQGLNPSVQIFANQRRAAENWTLADVQARAIACEYRCWLLRRASGAGGWTTVMQKNGPRRHWGLCARRKFGRANQDGAELVGLS